MLLADNTHNSKKQIKPIIHYFRKSHNTVHSGGLFALKQWISSSLKHDTVPRVINMHWFYGKKPAKGIAFWNWDIVQLSERPPSAPRTHISCLVIFSALIGLIFAMLRANCNEMFCTIRSSREMPCASSASLFA